MFAVGVFLLVTGYKKLEWNDIIKAWIPMVILSIIATPVNYEYGADYMQIYSGSGVPLMNTLAQQLASNNLRWLFTIIMLATYIPFGAVMVCLAKFVYYLIDKINAKKKPQEPEVTAEIQ